MSLKNHETEHPSFENGWLTWNHFAEKSIWKQEWIRIQVLIITYLQATESLQRKTIPCNVQLAKHMAKLNKDDSG